jgi:hypothetical protein
MAQSGYTGMRPSEARRPLANGPGLAMAVAIHDMSLAVQGAYGAYGGERGDGGRDARNEYSRRGNTC